MIDTLMADLKRRMGGVIDALSKEFSGLRAGRASATMLDPIMVDAYGAWMPLAQVGTVNAPEARLLTVQVWDSGLVKAVEKAIRDSHLGLNPLADGQLVRVPIPDLNEERRRELVKIAAKYTEHAKVSIRNVRRDGMDTLKKMEKSGDISEDDEHRGGTEIQTMTDSFVKKADEMQAGKEKDILHV